MKKLLIFVLFAGLSISLFSQSRGIGLGVILGEPTGISAKKWTSRTTAIDGAAAWSMLGQGFLHIHADALVHTYPIKVDSGKLPFYFGLGARVLLADDPAIGIRVPFGAAYHFHAAPFDVFVEFAPILDLIPATDFDFNSAFGIRYYLGS